LTRARAHAVDARTEDRDGARSPRLALLCALAASGCATTTTTTTTTNTGTAPNAAERATTGPRASAEPPAASWAARHGLVGRWSGTWRADDSPVGALNGTLEFSVSERGILRGLLQTPGGEFRGEVVGYVRPRGRFEGVCRGLTLQLTLGLRGSIELAANGPSVSGALGVVYTGRRVATVQLNAARQ
jgi:hypothetical protein